MPSVARRRRATQAEDESSEEDRRQSTQRNRRRAPTSSDEDEDEEEREGREDEMDVDARPDAQDQVVKKIVRYALACEFQRMPIRKTGITEKVIGKQRGSFKRVFEGAQEQLRTKFGMEMVELPVREKTTMKEKRAAQKSKGGSKTTSSYVLTTTLPTKYRIPEIMPPSIIGNVGNEAAYIGICSIIVSIIALSAGGTIQDARLMHHLKSMNLETNTPVGKTEDVLKKMISQGYIQKIVERNENDETMDWIVGPRGKVELAAKGIRGLVLEVYGGEDQELRKDVDQKVQKALGLELNTKNRANEQQEEEEEEAEEEPDNGDPDPSTARRASGRRR
ncbi:MAGE-domain-containing protein [Acephala macrosclerotiorum]|nr:MAGE-domain-containing protein [Acephala macrosclerotiorum]